MTVTYEDFDYEWFREIPFQNRKKGNQKTTQRYHYIDLITAFDIETT